MTTLVGYQPPLPAGPYRETGPVFAHAEPCAGPPIPTGYPPAFRGRPQALRAYDRRGWLRDAHQRPGAAPLSRSAVGAGRPR